MGLTSPRQLRLAIDGNEANVTHRVGSNVYAYEILTQLEQLTRQPVTEMTMDVTILLSEPPVRDLPKSRAGWQYQVITPKKLWTQWALPLHLFLNRGAYDVLFTPGHYAPRISPVPYVSAVMDLAFLEFPDQFKKNDWLQLSNWTNYSVKNAEKVIAISEATKRDIVKKYKIKPEKVVVAYPAVTTPVKLPTSLKRATTLKKLGITPPYLVYVGTLQPRKNVIKLVDAFESVKRSLASSEMSMKSKIKKRKESQSLQLVLVGKIGWLADDTIQRIKDSPFFEDILITGYVTDEVKRVLLQEAEASILVGLYEGFGIPPLESLHLGTVPIVSNTSSLPEVVGQAGILVNPESPTSIGEGIKKALKLSAKEKAKYRREMRTQIKKFSWRESATIILETLTQVVSNQ